jgi:hypothetical protein
MVEHRYPAVEATVIVKLFPRLVGQGVTVEQAARMVERLAPRIGMVAYVEAYHGEE